MLPRLCRRALLGMTLGLSLAARADYPATVLADSPAGYWRLNEMPVTYADPIQVTNRGSLGSAADGTFGGYVARGVAGALPGSTDTAFQFANAESSRVTMGSASSFNFTGTTSFTLECWAKPTAALSGSQRLIANGSSGQGYAFCFQGTTQLRITAFGVADVTSDVAPVAFAPNQWYHLAVVRSNNQVYFYTNGARFGSPKTLSPNNVITTANPLTLGRTAAGGEPFTGVIDEAAVYAGVVSGAQLATHYFTGMTNSAGYETAILADAPLGYWRLNEPPKPQESTSVIANTGSLGAPGNGSVFGPLNSVVGGGAGAIVGDADTSMGYNANQGKIDVANNAALNPASFTVECWARVDAWANTHQSPVTCRNSGATGNRGYIFYAAPSTASAPRWEFWTGAGGAFGVSSAVLPDVVLGQWAHLLGTYDAATGLKLFYVNGQLVGGATGATVVTNEARPLRIGAGASETTYGSFFMNGAVDEVAVYPGILGPNRVQAHYEAALGTSPAVVAAPGVAVNPTSLTNWAPYPVTVSCVVTGSLPMQLQWYHVSADGLSTNAVAGGTNLALTINPSAASDTGNYYLAATNALGGAESAWAWVEITPPTPPAFTLDLPAASPVYVGGTAGLDARAAGTPPITYLLQSNAVTVAVSTNGSFKIPNVQPAHASVNYQVLATNLFGSTPSATCNLSVLTAPVSTYAATATNLNPAGYWRLGEDGGTTAFDYWAGMNGDYVNAIPNMPGALVDDDDGAVQEFGAGNYTRMRDAQAFNYNGTTNRFSLVAWIKADAWSATGARFFSTRLLVGNTGGYGFGVWNGNSYRFTAFGVTDVAQSLPTLNVGQWYHVAAVCSNLTVYFYLNGVYQGTGNNPIAAAGIKTSPWPLQLGGNPNFAAASDEEQFNGTIDEAAVFGRVLTATEIKALYDSRYGSLVPPTITREPASVRLYAGGTARFSVEASGSSPLSYQWMSNGVALAGATTTALVVPAVTVAQDGANYTVTVTNRAGIASSLNATVTVLTAAGYPAAVVQDNPAGLWRLGETPGSPIAYDSWGSFNGAPSGNVMFGVPGALGGGDTDTAAAFDGFSPTKVEVPYAAELNANSFTVECWARVVGGAGSYRAAVSSRNEVQGGNQGGFIIYATDANVWSFWTSVGAGWQTLNGPAVVDGEWTHLVATYDGTEKRLYVNGALAGATPATAVPNPTRPLRIGAGQNEVDPGNYFFTGDVDEVAVYGHVLSADRVAYHYGLGEYGTTTAPFIVRDPQPQSIGLGGSATFSVVAGGSPVLGYQWWLGGNPVAGATESSFTHTNAAYSDNTTIQAVVSNGIGTTNSQAVQLSVLPPPQFANLTNDLVLHLEFEDNADDSSGRANNGIAIGPPGFVNGVIGAKALSYGTDTAAFTYNYVTLGTPADLAFSTNVNFSVAYWVRFTNAPPDLPFLCTAVNSYGNVGISFAPGWLTGTWSYYIAGTTGPGVGTGYGMAVVNDGAWHSLVHTFDRTGDAITYLDGVLVDTRAFAAVGNLDNGQPWNIGQDPTGAYPETAAGELDDVGIWRRVLTIYEAESIAIVGRNYGRSFNTYGPVELLVQPLGNEVQVIWQAGTLEQNSDLNNPAGWAPVPGATAPYYKVPTGVGQKFYRVKL
jgi:hypothetical protein